MKILVVAWKSLLELWREPLVLILSSSLPLVFLLLYVVAYSVPEVNTLRIAVVNHNAQGTFLIDELSALHHPDGSPVFNFQVFQNTEGVEDLLKTRKLDALLFVEPGTASDPFSITVRGDALAVNFIQAGSLLDSAIAQISNRMAGRIDAVGIREVPLQTMAGVSRYAFLPYAPGMIIFALLTLIPSTAILLGREMRSRTMDRIRISGLRTMEYLGGVGLSQMIQGILQAGLVIIALQAVHVPMLNLWLVVLLTILVIAASSIAAGLMLGAFIRNDSQAVNIGYTITMVQVFMCGAFFPVPSPVLFTIAGHRIGLFDWLPATQGVLALQQALIFGSGLDQVGFRLGAAALLAAIWFVIAVYLFRRARMGDQARG